jgi:hypothetical protein
MAGLDSAIHAAGIEIGCEAGGMDPGITCRGDGMERGLTGGRGYGAGGGVDGGWTRFSH